MVAPLGRVVLRTRLEGREHLPDGGAVLASNHVSYLDALLVTQVSARPIRVVAERTYLHLPLLGPLLRGCGVIAVERGSGGRDTLDELAGLLATGDLVLLFPEGGLRRGTPIGPLQRGAAVAALRAGAPLVPIAIGGHRPLAPWRRRSFVRIGRPLAPEGTSRELTERLAAALRELLAGDPSGRS